MREREKWPGIEDREDDEHCDDDPLQSIYSKNAWIWDAVYFLRLSLLPKA